MKNVNANQWFSVRVAAVILGVVALVTGSTVTPMVFAVSQTLPTCTDPTGQNLPCMMIISTLPPPANAVECQEPSGQILPCSYATQSLSNGEEVVAITVYVSANYVFTGYGPWTVVKQVLHETKTTTKTKIVTRCPETQRLNPETHKCVDVPVCQKDQYLVFVGKFICIPIRPPPPPPPCNGPHLFNRIAPCPPKPTCDSKYYTGPCPPTDKNAYIKCISAALAAGDDKNGLACARLLPDSPENAYTKCISEALFKGDNIAALKCAKLLPSPTQNAHNLTNTTAGAAAIPPSNTSAAILPTNTSIPSSGGSGAGSTCVNNCTTGTPPTVDCTKNPTDPSCTQTLTPSTTTPTTKTRPDGSQSDSSGNCPSNQPPLSNPSGPSSQPSNIPPSNNPSSGNGNGNSNGGGSGGSGSSNGGSISGGSSSSSSGSSGGGGSGNGGNANGRNG